MSATEYYKGIIIMSKRKSFYGGKKVSKPVTRATNRFLHYKLPWLTMRGAHILTCSILHI